MPSSGWWRWRKPSAGLLFTNGTIAAFKNGGSQRFEQRDIPEGLVDVTAATPNVHSVNDLAQLAQSVLASIGVGNEPLALGLPDLAVTTTVLRGRGRVRERELKQQFATLLPYPLDEARCDFWYGRRGEVLAASVRDVVARQYEQVVEAVGCGLAWVDAVSLAKIPTWASRPARLDEVDVLIQLYPEHYCMSVFRGGELVDARTKLRAANDVGNIVREIQRVPALHDESGEGAVDSLLLCGGGARAVADALQDSPGVRAVRVDNDDDELNLQSSLQALLERGNP